VEERSPKKSKVEVPQAPPSTVRKLFGWVMPTKSTTSKAFATSTHTDKDKEQQQVLGDTKGKGKAVQEGQTLKDRLEAIQDQPLPMTQLSDSVSVSVSRPAPLPISNTLMAPPHPSSPAWKTAGPSRLSPSSSIPATYSNTKASSSSSTSTRPTPRTLSAILAESSSSTIASSQRGQLHSSLSQRSAALDALFSGSGSTSTKAAVPIIKRSSSVKDMVRSFEDSGILGKSMGGDGLKRV
jgi:hypothetical protein